MKEYKTTTCRLENETVRQHLDNWLKHGHAGYDLVSVAPSKIDPDSGMVMSYVIVWEK